MVLRGVVARNGLVEASAPGAASRWRIPAAIVARRSGVGLGAAP
jgi:hypothetical protein